MASTAALMQAMESFDSSVDATHHHAGAGHLTAGGISLAPSFHSEDYDDEPPVTGFRHAGKYAPQEESSLMEEEEMFDVGAEAGGGDSGISEDAPEPQPHVTRRPAGGSRPPSALSATTGGTGTQRTQASSRYPSASTAPTEEPASPKRRARIPSGVAVDLARDESSRQDDQSVSGGQSAVLGGLNVDDSAYSSNWQAKGESGGTKKSGRGGIGQNMTLREQEKVIDEFKKENFDLKLKIHFYEQRLERLAPDHIDQALRENIQLKVEFQTLRIELKRYKKLLLEGNRAIESLTRERDQALRNTGASASSGSRRERELERELARLRQVADRDREDRDALERKVGDQSRELRDVARKTKSSDYGGEDSRAEIARLRDELDAEREAHEEALADQDHLRFQLQEATDRLEEAQEDIERLRDGKGSPDAGDSSAFGDQSRSRQLGEGKSRRQLEIENDDHRDRASAHALEVERLESELAKKEQEIEELLGDIDQRDIDHATALKQTDGDWKGEVEDARLREARIRDLLDEKESDIDELADKVESLMKELREKEETAAADAEEVEALTHDLQKLGSQIFALEEEADEKDSKIRELEAELDSIDTELKEKQRQHEQAISALKDELSKSSIRLSEMNAQHESLSSEHGLWRDRAAKLEELSRADANAKRRLEDEAVEIMRALRKEEEEREQERQEWSRKRREEEAQWQRTLESRLNDAHQAREQAAQLQSLVDIRERDVRTLQDTLNGVEASLNRAGQTHSSDRSALEVELERLKRDLSRSEQDLATARRNLEEKAAALRDEELRTMTLESENKDLSQQLASQTQTRLALTDKYDEASKDQRQWKNRLQTKQAEVDSSKSLITELQTQIATLRTTQGSPGSSAKIIDLTTRASRAERHLAATQAQLADAESKLGEAREKVAVAEGKWEARVKEFERLVKALKEENKRLKQGAKERVSELEDFIQSLQEEKKRADHRKAHLDDVLTATERNKAAAAGVAR